MASEPPPPPLPPPIPLRSEDTAARTPGLTLTQTLILEGRLHPLTLLFAAWHAVRGMLIPMAVLVFFGRKRSEDFYLFLSLMFLLLPIGIAVIKYFTFSYRIENGELITRHGILGRTQRNIPLSRVQD